MNQVNGKSFGSEDTVTLDNFTFTSCSFRGCTIIYHGGITQWSNCHFDSFNLVLGDAAHRTKKIMEALGFKIVPASGFELNSTSSTIQ